MSLLAELNRRNPRRVRRQLRRQRLAWPEVGQAGWAIGAAKSANRRSVWVLADQHQGALRPHRCCSQLESQQVALNADPEWNCKTVSVGTLKQERRLRSYSKHRMASRQKCSSNHRPCAFANADNSRLGLDGKAILIDATCRVKQRALIEGEYRRTVTRGLGMNPILETDIFDDCTLYAVFVRSGACVNSQGLVRMGGGHNGSTIPVASRTETSRTGLAAYTRSVGIRAAVIGAAVDQVSARRQGDGHGQYVYRARTKTLDGHIG